MSRRRPLPQAQHPFNRDNWALTDKSHASKRIKLIRKVRALLNKLSPTNYVDIKEAMKEYRLAERPVLKQCISILFEKSLAEPVYCPLYAMLCRDLSFHEMYCKRNSKSEIRNEMLQMALDMFNTRNIDEELAVMQAQIGRAEGEWNKSRIRFEMREAQRKFAARRMANFRLMGHLFNNKIAGIGMMNGSLDDLLKSVSRKPTNQDLANYKADVFSIEGAIAMLTIAGKALEEARSPPFPMDKTFATLKEAIPLVSGFSPRIKFLIINLFELRARNWIPRIVPDGPVAMKKKERAEGAGETTEVVERIVVPATLATTTATTTTSTARPSSAPQSREQSVNGKRSSSEEAKAKSPTSSLPTSLSADELELLEECSCIICAELFDSEEHTPRFLECGHTFCHKCIYTWRTARVEPRTGRVTKYIKCPTCTAVHDLPDSKTLVPNYALIAIADKLRKSQERPRESPVEQLELLMCKACEQKHPPSSIRVCTKKTCSMFEQWLCVHCVVDGQGVNCMRHVSKIDDFKNLNKIQDELRTKMTSLFSSLEEERAAAKARVLAKIEQQLEARLPTVDEATERRLAAQLDGIASEQASSLLYFRSENPFEEVASQYYPFDNEALFFKDTLDELISSHRSEFGAVEKALVTPEANTATRGAQPEPEEQPLNAEVIDLTTTSPANTSSSEVEE